MVPMARSVMPSQAIHYARGSIFGHAKSSRRVADGPSVAVRPPEAVRSQRHGGGPANNNNTIAGVRAGGDRRGNNAGAGVSSDSKSNRSRFVSDALQMFRSSGNRDKESKSHSQSNRSIKGDGSTRAAGEDGASRAGHGRGHGHGHGHGHAQEGDASVRHTSPGPQKALASFRSGNNSPGG